jgi:amidohydrolase
LAGTVKIIFQPAEESGRGSLHILETGVLEEVEAIFGLHNSPSLPLGALGTRSGPFYAAVDRFEIEIKGAGAHAATPEKGTDPIVIAAQIVSSLQTIVSRNISAFDQALISVTQLTCGNTWNVIPETAYLQGTVRTLKAETRKLILDRIRQLSSGIATAFNASAEISFSDGPSAVYNDSKWTDFAFNVAEASGFITEEIPPELIGEDFSDYQKHIPGVFVNIGTGTPYPLHHPKFTVDDNILLKTAHYFAILAEAALHELTTG